jgi:hypothetical protein
LFLPTDFQNEFRVLEENLLRETNELRKLIFNLEFHIRKLTAPTNPSKHIDVHQTKESQFTQSTQPIYPTIVSTAEIRPNQQRTIEKMDVLNFKPIKMSSNGDK